MTLNISKGVDKAIDLRLTFPLKTRTLLLFTVLLVVKTETITLLTICLKFFRLTT